MITIRTSGYDIMQLKKLHDVLVAGFCENVYCGKDCESCEVTTLCTDILKASEFIKRRIQDFEIMEKMDDC